METSPNTSTMQKASPHRHILFNIQDQPYFICTSQIGIIILNQNALFFKTNNLGNNVNLEGLFHNKKLILSDISMPLHEDKCIFLCGVEYKHLKLWGVVFQLKIKIQFRNSELCTAEKKRLISMLRKIRGILGKEFFPRKVAQKATWNIRCTH